MHEKVQFLSEELWEKEKKKQSWQVKDTKYPEYLAVSAQDTSQTQCSYLWHHQTY